MHQKRPIAQWSMKCSLQTATVIVNLNAQDLDRALEVAISQWSNGQLSTLAWCAAGIPDTGIGPEDIRVYQNARAVVQASKVTIRPGDEQRLVERFERGADD